MDLNELKRQYEETGDWNDALAKIKEATDGKDIAAAMKEGWKIEDFAKLLLDESTVETEGKETPVEQPTSEALLSVSHMEAPASFNTYYISPGGFRWQLTIRPGLAAKEMITLLERTKKAEDWLLKKGYKPYVPFRGGGNANARTQQAGGNGGNGSKSKYCSHKSDEPGFCPTHGKELKKSQHHPGYYCPTKI